MRTSFISLILLLLLGACRRPEVTERLAHAERIMNAHPDSALQLLRAIDAPHKLRGKDRATMLGCSLKLTTRNISIRCSPIP